MGQKALFDHQLPPDHRCWHPSPHLYRLSKGQVAEGLQFLPSDLWAMSSRESHKVTHPSEGSWRFLVSVKAQSE